jgi:hypothetical protein
MIRINFLSTTESLLGINYQKGQYMHNKAYYHEISIGFLILKISIEWNE